jgi:hypothetical protein
MLPKKLGKGDHDGLGHMETMPDRRTVKEVFKNIPKGKWSVRKTKKDLVI